MCLGNTLPFQRLLTAPIDDGRVERPPDHPLLRCVLVVGAALDPQTGMLGD